MTATKRIFRIVNHSLDYPMYASMALVESGSQFSDRIEDATEFVEGEDSPETKLKWFKAVAKLKGYDPDKVAIEWEAGRP